MLLRCAATCVLLPRVGAQLRLFDNCRTARTDATDERAHSERCRTLCCRKTTSGAASWLSRPRALRSLLFGFLPAMALRMAPRMALKRSMPECIIFNAVWYWRCEIARCRFQYFSILS